MSRIAEGFFINRSGVFICIEACVSLAWDDVVVDLAYTHMYLIILNAVTSNSVYFIGPSLVLILYDFSLGHSKHIS